ncbi:glycosyltransferase family 87 protein [Streptomyces sp. Ru72]|uniref:glycosyltransferase family 87 protein n=1 Tax=Streptomyces sp. Ru72 TaxID=2080747 RepID=UPI00215623F7|nr:glycosyltransferase family 87 protein [Streptomyces sp. Ru72]
MLVFRLVTLPVSDGNAEEVALYHKWLEVFQSGSFPVGDETWQYPPGMSLALLAPVLLPVLTYQHAFYVTAFLVDAAVFAALWRTGRQPGRSMMGAWVWTIGVPLLGSMPYARLDMTVTGICVAALLWLPTRPRVGGALVGVGATMKLWPVLVLLGVGPGGTMRTVWARALGAAVALTLMLAAVLPGAWSFLSGQRARGLQIESFGALPFHVARHFGWPGQVELAYGAMQFTGPYAELVAYALPALSVFALGGLVLLRWHLPRSFFTGAAPSVLGLAAVLVCIFTSRVFSPQFMLWAVGLLAVGTTWRSSGLRTTARLVLAACGFTLVIYPFTYFDVMASTWSAIITLAVRDALLVTAAVHLLRTLRTAARAAGDQSAEASGLVPRPQSAEETDEVVATR